MTYRIVKIVGYCRGQLLSINVNIPAVFRKFCTRVTGACDNICGHNNI